MKKIIPFLLIIGFVLLLGACNSPSDDSKGGGGGGGGEDTEWNVNYLYKMGESTTYPGAEVDLSDRDLVDISNYQSITVNAILYTDEEGKTKAVTPTGDNKNLAQFKLLKASGNWDTDSNLCGMYKDEKKENTKYNMNVDGDTTWTFPDGAGGVPAKLLLQANWADFTGDGVKVKSIKVNKITFTAKTGAPVLDEAYDKGDFITVAGNKITFNNTTYEEAAAIYVFPDTWTKQYLTGKQLVISFSIPEPGSNPSTSGASDVEYQIHIQAANSDKNGYNGQNPSGSNGNIGQKYITLDSFSETGWTDADKGGTFKVSLNDLLSAAAVTANADDCKGPFTLDAIRIVNNGTSWNGDGTNHVRYKSYTLVINSVKVE